MVVVASAAGAVDAEEAGPGGGLERIAAGELGQFLAAAKEAAAVALDTVLVSPEHVAAAVAVGASVGLAEPAAFSSFSFRYLLRAAAIFAST